MSATTAPSADRFEFGLQVESDVAFVRLTGELDHHSADRFTGLMEAAFAGQASSAVLDCAGLTFIDSGGVAALIDLQAAAARRGGYVVVTEPREMVERVLRIVGLDGLISRP